jgi:hypothetical protein
MQSNSANSAKDCKFLLGMESERHCVQDNKIQKDRYYSKLRNNWSYRNQQGSLRTQIDHILGCRFQENKEMAEDENNKRTRGK